MTAMPRQCEVATNADLKTPKEPFGRVGKEIVTTPEQIRDEIMAFMTTGQGPHQSGFRGYDLGTQPGRP